MPPHGVSTYRASRFVPEPLRLIGGDAEALFSLLFVGQCKGQPGGQIADFIIGKPGLQTSFRPQT
jgi:hypothetical protein